MTPHDLMPFVIPESMDWFSFAANSCSIGGFVLTVWVLRVVRKVEDQYVFQLSFAVWDARLKAHATAISALRDEPVFPTEAFLEEATKARAFVRSIAKQMPSELKAVSRDAHTALNRRLDRTLFHSAPLVDSAAAADVYLKLVAFYTELDNHYETIRNRPAR